MTKNILAPTQHHNSDPYGEDPKMDELLAKSCKKTLLRFCTAGSVDDGKSTLIGRLLHDSKNIYDDHIASLEGIKLNNTESQLPLALLTDGLRAEREQGITIDVAYRYFSTPNRHFILADTPGHVQYTRNMATGASTANVAIVLIDARYGIVTQSKRHAFVLSLVGVPRFLVTVNKMDLVDYSEERFDQIRLSFLDFASKLDIKSIDFIPVSALNGDNIVSKSDNMPWYAGQTVMEYLETVHVAGDQNLVDFRFPVQYVIRPHQNYRGYAGQISSGTIKVGEEIMVLPSLRKSKIKSIDQCSLSTPLPTSHTSQIKALQSASALMSVAITLEDELDISRGDMIVRTRNAPRSQKRFEAIVIWMSENAMQTNKHYILMHTTHKTKVFIDSIDYRIDVDTLHRLEGKPLELNEIGRVMFHSAKPLFLDTYKSNRTTGGFILVDEATFQTVAACMVIDRLPNEYSEDNKHLKLDSVTPPYSSNIHKELGVISKTIREAKIGNKAFTVWLTGLSSSGKSSIARVLEERLFTDNFLVYRLDGDNLRFGLNRDLGFSEADRSENIRRVAEVARLFNLAGMITLCSFISPFKVDRKVAKDIIGDDNFIEVYVSTPLHVCESRDPHSLYKKARAGEIREFTGISSPYEIPDNPSLKIDTSDKHLHESADIVYNFLKNRYLVRKD